MIFFPYDHVRWTGVIWYININMLSKLMRQRMAKTVVITSNQQVYWYRIKSFVAYSSPILTELSRLYGWIYIVLTRQQLSLSSSSTHHYGTISGCTRCMLLLESEAGEERNFAGAQHSVVSRWLISTANRVRIILLSESVS